MNGQQKRNKTAQAEQSTSRLKIFPLLVFFSLLPLFFISDSLFSSSSRSHSPIEEIRTIIKEQALHPPPSKVLAQLKMKNLAEGLRKFDPYGHYISSSATTSKATPGPRFGIRLFRYSSRIWLRPDPAGPAMRQGLPEISELKKINNKRISTDLAKTSKHLDQAKASGEVTFTLYDQYQKKDYTITPESYQPKSVTTHTSGQYIFIHITDFISHRTAPYFSSLYKAIQQRGTKIILDLRGCPGGDLFEALEIAGMFVPADSKMLTTYNRDGKVHTYRSPTGKKLTAPAWLLIDDRTASAAEILAGIIGKSGVSRLMGVKSYGKCVSQTVYDLSNGGKLWLTTLSTLFADDTSCTKRGVEADVIYPDITIARSSEIVMKISRNTR